MSELKDFDLKVAFRCSATIKIGDPLRADEIKCRCTSPFHCVGIKREVLIQPADFSPEQQEELRLAQFRAAEELAAEEARNGKSMPFWPEPEPTP